MIWRTGVLLLLSVITALAGYCGDGIAQPGVEQCDTGMRCVSRSNILPWTGAGPSLGPRMVGVSFQYSVSGYGGPETTQLLYGMTILVGSTPLANQYEYTLSCSNMPSSGGIVVRIVPSVPVFALAAHAVGIEWTFGAPAACDAALNGTLVWTPANLTSVFMQYNGAAATDIWSLSASGSPLNAASYGPGSTLCGTECCDSSCKRTWATVYGDACPSGAPSPSTSGYYCQGDATCILQNRSLVNDVIPTCGDGIVEAPEECDTGLWPAITYTYFAFGVLTPAPLSPLIGWWTQVHYSALSTTLYQQTFVVATYSSGPSPVDVVPSNSSYVMLCELTGPTTMVFTMQAAENLDSYIPQMIATYTYTVGPGVNCSNWAIAPITLLFQDLYAVLIDEYGNSTYVSTATQDALWTPGAVMWTTTCCGAGCVFTGASGATICPYGTPETIPVTPDYMCQGAGFGTCAEVPTPSATASISRSPSITASASITPSPSASTGASQSITPSPSPSLGASQSNTPTGTAEPSASIPTTPSQTMTPAPTRKPQSTTPWIVFGSLTGYTCVASCVVLMLWYILWRQHMEGHRRSRENRERREREEQAAKTASVETGSESESANSAPEAAEAKTAQAAIVPGPTASLLKTGSSISASNARGGRRVRFGLDLEQESDF